MTELAFVVARIGEWNLEKLQALATRARVPYSTVLKVARGYTKNPKAETVGRLATALRPARRKKRGRA